VAFYTASELRSSGLRTASRSFTSARAILTHRGQSASADDYFDIFLSHSYQDAATILGVVELLEAQRIRVYVDWINDRQLDRSMVTSQTADVLRQRMRQCTSLIFATSTSTPASKWMPWELGYFDGLNGDQQISIMPIEEDETTGYLGQEYLGLYRAIEKLSSRGGDFMAAVSPDQRDFMEIYDFATGFDFRQPLTNR
jgi:hypothetical protein